MALRFLLRPPGFGVNLASAGPPSGTVLGIETTGGLLYWNGLVISATDAVVTIEAPTSDSLGNDNTTTVETYEVTDDSPPLTGMTWSVYLGDSFWDAHGNYTLSQPVGIGGTPAAGLYGVPLQFVSGPSGPSLGPSEAFVLPLLFDPAGVWTGAEVQVGIDAMSALLSTPVLGDYDGNGSIEPADYVRWQDDYGQVVSLPGSGADGSGDGAINAADYTVWRDAMNVASVLTVPEPSTEMFLILLLAGFSICSANVSRSFCNLD